MVYSGRMGNIYQEGYEEGRKQGLADGKESAHEQMIEWLQQEYLKPEVIRGTGPALAILELARRMNQEFQIK